jgi:hypothetical protein
LADHDRSGEREAGGLISRSNSRRTFQQRRIKWTITALSASVRGNSDHVIAPWQFCLLSFEGVFAFAFLIGLVASFPPRPKKENAGFILFDELLHSIPSLGRGLWDLAAGNLEIRRKWREIPSMRLCTKGLLICVTIIILTCLPGIG